MHHTELSHYIKALKKEDERCLIFPMTTVQLCVFFYRRWWAKHFETWQFWLFYYYSHGNFIIIII